MASGGTMASGTGAGAGAGLTGTGAGAGLGLGRGVAAGCVAGGAGAGAGGGGTAGGGAAPLAATAAAAAGGGGGGGAVPDPLALTTVGARRFVVLNVVALTLLSGTSRHGGPEPPGWTVIVSEALSRPAVIVTTVVPPVYAQNRPD